MSGNPTAPGAVPLVTVVVPVFNGARFVRESLRSIVEQRYRPLEILVMDDASTDQTPSIVAEFGERVRYHRQPRNRGQFDNVNDGIRLARGELIAVYHADDVYLPGIVEREAAFLARHANVGAVFCLDIFIDSEGREYGRLQLPQELRGGGVFEYAQVLDALLRHNNTFLRTPGAMVRASTYRSVGPYRSDFGSCADFDMWVRVARHFPIGIIDDHLYEYRHFEGQASRQYERLRVTPSRNFEILDACLGETAGVVTTAARLAYEGHRAEDSIIRAASLYVRGDLADARAVLKAVSARAVLASGRPNRARLFLLLSVFRLLMRLPRVSPLAAAFRRRWQERAPRRPMTRKHIVR